MRRGFWFVAGAGAGVYVMIRARRAAETFTPDGLRDRMAGLSVGAHLFAEEVRTGMVERETELRDRLGLALDGPLQIESHPAESRPAESHPVDPHPVESPQQDAHALEGIH